MVPTPINVPSRSPRLLYPFASFIVHGVPKLIAGLTGRPEGFIASSLQKRASEAHGGKLIAFAILIPVLVLLSGLFAGLTLGYMSLDETQLHVLSISGTPKQKEYAKKIQPIRKNGHLLLVTLLLANMIVNETLPVISDPVFHGGVQSVVVSTVLIVIFSEIIPQSLCTRYGLAIGAHMAWLVRILIYVFGVVAWPVAKLLEFILGPHHGIMYRRGELKELIALHANTGLLGGDLKSDTITIIGATLDLQEKVVQQAMTPIKDVFMLRIDSKLDHDTMKRIYETGHSRVPVFEEVEVPVMSATTTQGQSSNSSPEKELPSKTEIVKKIVGVLLVKQCLMLDPKDAVPLRSLHLNKVLYVAGNQPLLEVLDKFQEGHSHMAIVGRFSVEKAASVKREVKRSLTRRLKDRVGIHDSSSSSSESSSDESDSEGSSPGHEQDKDATLRGEGKRRRWGRRKKNKQKADVEKGDTEVKAESAKQENKGTVQTTWALVTSVGREQSMPDDAVLPKDNAEVFLQSLDPAVMPLGIITLEDVLEELIGEEIYDEFDSGGHSRLKHYATPNKRKGSRQDNNTLTGPNSGAVAIPQITTTSYAVSPAISESVSEPVPSAAGAATPKGVSLGPSLTALVTQKKLRGESTPKSGSKHTKPHRRSSAPVTSTDTAYGDGTGDAASEIVVSDPRTDHTGTSIPNKKEKDAPDIA